MPDKKLFHAIAALLFALILASAGAASSENMLRNPDFSELNGEGMPEDWYTDAYYQEPGYSVFRVSEDDAEHPSAVSIQNIGENDARFAQTVRVNPDSLYLLSGYVRADEVEGGHGANLSIEGIYAFSEEFFETNGKWQYIEYYGETGPDQDEITVFARLGGYSGISTGKAWFADLSLTEVDGIPGDTVADLWYRQSDNTAYDEDEDLPDESGTFRPVLILTGVLYTLAAAYAIHAGRRRSMAVPDQKRIPSAWVAAVLLAAMALRVVISYLVEGYMVDVNCFLSWGNTMVSVGPAQFYEATNFCDYPPLYTYFLAVNSFVSGLFGGGAGVSRVVFRFIPCLCDLAGCWLLYRLLLKQSSLDASSSFLFLAFMSFHPAMILNSAAWGQMDSVLCLLLLAVVLFALKRKWRIALPLYVVAVLVKPQALMLGPLGLAYLILSWLREPQTRKTLLQGAGISVIVLLACVIPFSLNQPWDWLIRLYGRTLASYPYATVNTANFYYLLKGNWSAVSGTAHLLAPLLLSVLCAGYGFWWHIRARNTKLHLAETFISLFFSAGFLLCACLGASWAWNGVFAMAFAFVIVISTAVRSGEIRMLPWLGGFLFILLYVFGVKMHERYVFPAILLLSASWVLLRDRRILFVLLLFSLTLFINEGIVLDNSIRLGSGLGHLNSDTVWLADLISILNIAGALYAVRLNTELLFHCPPRQDEIIPKAAPDDWHPDRKMHWHRMDTILLGVITAVYSAVSLLTLGSTRAPQTVWSSSSACEQIVFDLGEVREDFEILYFAQVSRHDFSVSASIDGQNWQEETWAQMEQGQCWKWKYVTMSFESEGSERIYYNSDESYIIRFTGRYIRLTSCQLGLKLNEILFRDTEGNILPATISGRTGEEPESELYSDPANLVDEQDSLEGLPSFPASPETSGAKAEPSWWNSTYFDEIYHARTAYEFLQGSVPYETSHPPLGKVLMSFSVALFGMTPFGWRFAGALAGILMLPGMYLLLKQISKKTRIAVMGCLLMALDCFHLTQTQIATIDSFPVLFIIFAYFFMLRFLQTDYLREKTAVSLVSLAFSGLFMGLSIASKWIGIYAGAGLAILFFWHCFRVARIHRQAAGLYADPDLPEARRVALGKAVPDPIVSSAFRRFIVLCAWCILFFVIIPVAVYLASYIPYLAYNFKRIHSLGDYIIQVWNAQVGMFNYHSTPNLGMDHPFYSPWWEWPVIGKPMYYASQQYLPSDHPVHHSIFCFGNPVIWFGGLAALAVCVFRSLTGHRFTVGRRNISPGTGAVPFDPRYVFLFIGLLAQYLPWVLVPRGTYIYHYFASLPFLMTSICLCFDGDNTDRNRIIQVLSAAFIITSAVFFILLFPYASGMNVSADWLDIGRNILRIWY